MPGLSPRSYPGPSKEVTDALAQLTKRRGEPYEAFIERVKINPIAARVKLADLNDNLDVRRFKDPSMVNVDRIKRYIRAKAVLTEAMNNTR